ncbi:MAG: hypothetical protein V2I33_25185, partial [Kangiellaceae bacterium]|nr:hypothetical protein [Kangiellaceae bacterium]
MDVRRSNIFDMSNRITTQLQTLDSLIVGLKKESDKAHKQRVDVQEEFEKIRKETMIRDPMDTTYAFSPYSTSAGASPSPAFYSTMPS